MSKLPLRIEIVRSNTTLPNNLSLVSANAIVETLSLHYSDVILTHVNTTADLNALVARKPDLAFLGMYYVIGDNDEKNSIWLSDVLKKNNIHYTGSGQFSNHLANNKHLAKQQMIESGLHTSPFQIVQYKNDDIINKGSLSFPLFVKPDNLGGGQGVDEFSVVRTNEALRSKVTAIHRDYRCNALIEEFLVGREFSIAVIANSHTDTLMAMPIELVAAVDVNGERMLSKQVKASNAETVRAVTDPAERRLLKTFAIDAFKALGAQDYGRIDVRLNELGVPQFLEANLIPSLIDGYGSFPKACEINLGINYETMLLQIVRLALNRAPQQLLSSSHSID